MKYERGFRTWAEEIAEDAWKEPVLANPNEIDISEYARSLDIPVFTIGSLSAKVGLEVAYFKGARQSSLSAYTIMFGFQERIIFYNESHHVHRQRSSIAHELGHALLNHESTPPLTTNGGRNFDRPMEDEAEYLGAALLIPKSKAINALLNDDSVDQVAEKFNVSKQLARWRLGVSGAQIIVNRIREKKR